MYIFNSADEIKKLIDSNRMVAIYFSGNSCGACKVIKVKIEHILKKYPNIKACEINGEEHLDIATSYGIFSVPITSNLKKVLLNILKSFSIKL